MLLEDAESIAKQAVIFIHSGKDRALLILKDRRQLFVGILALPVFKKIRAAFMVDQGHLGEQFVDPRRFHRDLLKCGCRRW